MNLSEIAALVIKETGRIDQQDLIIGYVKSAILSVHSQAKFRRDCMEETIIVPSPNLVVRLTLPPRFRMFKDIAITNNYGIPVASCDKINPSQIVGAKAMLPNTPNYYVMGNSYTVASNRSAITIQYLYTSYYQSPDISSLASTTWLTESYPEVVVNYVSWKVNDKNGNKEKADGSLNKYRAALNDLLNDQEID